MTFKYALVFWPPTKSKTVGLSDIITAKSIPNAADRTDGAEPELPWVAKKKDPKTGKIISVTKLHKAKVLLMHNSKKFLESLDVNPKTGLVTSKSKKVFSSKVRIKKAHLTSVSKASLSIAHAQKQHDEMAMDNEESIFNSSIQLPTGNSVSPCDAVQPSSNEPPAKESVQSGSAEAAATEHNFLSFVSSHGLQITSDNITFLESLVQCMKTFLNSDVPQLSKNYTKTQSAPSSVTGPILISDKFTTFAKNKTEIAPNCGIYLNSLIYKYIERRSNKIDKNTLAATRCWKSLVRLTLIEIYGDNLQALCAKGSRHDTQGIDSHLYVGLFEWACAFSGISIQDQEFCKYINDCTRPKTNGKNKVSTPEVSPSPSVPTTPEVSLPPSPTASPISSSQPQAQRPVSALPQEPRLASSKLPRVPNAPQCTLPSTAGSAEAEPSHVDPSVLRNGQGQSVSSWERHPDHTQYHYSGYYSPQYSSPQFGSPPFASLECASPQLYHTPVNSDRSRYFQPL